MKTKIKYVKVAEENLKDFKSQFKDYEGQTSKLLGEQYMGGGMYLCKYSYIGLK